MKKEDPDLQHLVDEAVRKRVLVIPILTYKLGIYAASCAFFGLGLLMGSTLAKFSWLNWVGGLFIVSAFVLGRYANKREKEVMETLPKAEEPS